MIFTRRHFGLSLCAAAVPLKGAQMAPWDGPAIVHKVYLGSPRPTWPYPAVDYREEMRGLDARLADVEAKHPGVVRFAGGDLLLTGQDHKPWVKSTAGADAILVMDLSTSTGTQFDTLTKMETPLLLFQRPITS